MDESRRDFLKQAGCAVLGLGCGLPFLGAGCSSLEQSQAQAASSSIQWAMVVDLRKCLREEVRQACIDACHREHNVPHIPNPDDEVKWIWKEEFGHVFPEQVHAHSAAGVKESPVLVLCNHCEKPPCVKVCPTAATWRREQDGIVMMDMHRCIGCRYCIAACPYGSRSFNWRDPRDYIAKDDNGKLLSDYPTRSKGVVEKCNFCAERIRTGLQPACVEAVNKVPGGQGALTFGDLRDPASEVNQILRQRHSICRRVELGTAPKVFYI